MFKKYLGIELQLEKLEDTVFNGEHPNGFNPGHVERGVLNLELSENHRCFFITKGERYFHTSEIRKIEEKEGYDLVHTLNSVYKVTPVFASIPGVQEKYSVKVENQEESN